MGVGGCIVSCKPQNVEMEINGNSMWICRRVAAHDDGWVSGASTAAKSLLGIQNPIVPKLVRPASTMTR